MIEHPGGVDGVYVLHWKFDCPEGLVLQPVGLDGFGIDQGLYANADEFVSKLLRKLEVVVLSQEAYGPTS
jgi:hypothetical protein